MKNLFKLSGLFLVLSLFVYSCSDDDIPANPGSHDEFTDANITFTPVNNPNNKQFIKYKDGQQNPLILAKNTVYDVKIDLTANGNPANPQIINEKDKHFYVYQPAGINFNKFTRTDEKAAIRNDGNKIGIDTKWDVKDLDSSKEVKIVIILKHGSKAVNMGDENMQLGTEEGGEDDLTITLDNIKLQEDHGNVN